MNYSSIISNYSSIISKFFPNDDKKNHFKALDGLRGLAVLFVLLSHAGIAEMKIPYFLDFKNIGKYGVYLFFVLSAYLLDKQITYILINKKDNAKYWGRYFLRRFLRIYPLFTIMLLFNYALHVLKLGKYAIQISSMKEFMQHILLQKGNDVFWSIPVEFKYYFLSPLILILFNYAFKWDLKRIFYFLSLIVTCSIIYTYNKFGFKKFDPEWYELWTLFYLPIFSCGTLLAVWELLWENKNTNLTKESEFVVKIFGYLFALLILLSFPFCINSILSILGYEKMKQGFTHRWMFYLPYGIAWSTILFCTKHRIGYFASIFEWLPLRFLGTISFSLYLIHIPILKFVAFDLNLPSPVKLMTFLLISILSATITYLLVEYPISKINWFDNKPLS